MDLLDTLRKAGAVTGQEGARVLHFGDESAEVLAGIHTCALSDRSSFGRLLATGPDILKFLQRLGTADVVPLAAGAGTPTILTTPKGRIVERLIVQNLGSAGVLMVCEPGRESFAVAHLHRSTFREDLRLETVTERDVLLSLNGARAGEALVAAGLVPPPIWGALSSTIADAEVLVLGHDGLSTGGFAVLVAVPRASAVWAVLAEAAASVGGRPAGESALETLRVIRGIATAGHELTDEHNPLEAGQWEAVSFAKGCYVGQEVIARLRTYDKVSRSIVGLELSEVAALPEIGTRLYSDERPVGSLTSVVLPSGTSRPLALGYVKRKELRPGLTLGVGAPPSTLVARIVELPFPFPRNAANETSQ